MHVFIWDSSSIGLIVCLMFNGEERPLMPRAWIRPEDDFMYLNQSNQLYMSIVKNGVEYMAWTISSSCRNKLLWYKEFIVIVYGCI